MSPGKLAAQVSHGSMAFLTNMIREKAQPCEPSGIVTTRNEADEYHAYLRFDRRLYEQWLEGSFTKCVLEAKNKNKLLKAKELAEEIGLVEGKDFFLINLKNSFRNYIELNGEWLVEIQLKEVMIIL